MEQTAILQKNIYRVTLQYVSLNVISMLGLSLYILADTFFVANGVGNNGLVALNLALPVYSLINGIGLMIGVGGATRFSIAVGEGSREQCNKIFTHSLLLGLVLAGILTLLGVFCSDQLANLMGAKGGSHALASTYLKTVLCFSLAFIPNNILIAFVRNDGSPQLAMTAMLVASFGNILLDYIFVFPLGMGIFGAAFATGIAPILSMCVLSSHFLRKRHHFKLQRCPLRPHRFVSIVSTGMPSLVNEISTGIVLLIFNQVILSIAGDTGVGAYSIVANIALVCISIFTGVAQGMQPVVSLCYGAKKPKNIRRAFLTSCICVFVLGTLVYLVSNLFPEQIIALFNRDGNEQLALLAADGIRLYFTAFLLMGVSIVTISLFACIARPKPSFLISILRGFVLTILFIVVLPQIWGMTGVWLSVPAAELVCFLLSGILVLYLFRSMPHEDAPEPSKDVSHAS
ncbi:MATE family efflux transporter [Candidatus Soleaferrea massiliensis]|uniref:MATE family efflux transporter n=1 Tax=Candidatus Soleaferrea massiliensis TaxID=1470354 RepID=UPI0006932DFD|nr:MATE family efflux transporter [Candidatus Soleaferrea massiliensis]